MRLELRLADDLEAAASTYADGIVAEISRQVPSLFADPELADLAQQGVVALVREFAVVLRLDRDDGFHAPVAAVAFAERLARDGVPLAEVLRSYRIGQEAAFARAAEIVSASRDGDAAAALARVGALTFRFTDAVTTEATAAYEREREAGLTRRVAQREQVVAQLLNGADLDVPAAEGTLGYRLGGTHQAVVALGDADLAPLLAGLGSGRPLVVAAGAWLPGGIDLDVLRGRLGGARVAVGAPGPFVETRRQAERVAALADVVADPVLDYRELALTALLLHDRAAAYAFAAEQLGPLRERPALRETLAVYLDTGQDQTATAATLGVHRNTVARRLAEAQRLAGGRSPAAVRAALAIAAATG